MTHVYEHHEAAYCAWIHGSHSVWYARDSIVSHATCPRCMQSSTAQHMHACIHSVPRVVSQHSTCACIPPFFSHIVVDVCYSSIHCHTPVRCRQTHDCTHITSTHKAHTKHTKHTRDRDAYTMTQASTTWSELLISIINMNTHTSACALHHCSTCTCTCTYTYTCTYMHIHTCTCTCHTSYTLRYMYRWSSLS